MAFAWRQKAITWTDVDFSSKVFCGIHLKTNSQGIMELIHNTCVPQTFLSQPQDQLESLHSENIPPPPPPPPPAPPPTPPHPAHDYPYYGFITDPLS